MNLEKKGVPAHLLRGHNDAAQPENTPGRALARVEVFSGSRKCRCVSEKFESSQCEDPEPKQAIRFGYVKEMPIVLRKRRLNDKLKFRFFQIVTMRSGEGSTHSLVRFCIISSSFIATCPHGGWFQQRGRTGALILLKNPSVLKNHKKNPKESRV